MFKYSFPKRSLYEEERNYFWEKYFNTSLAHRRNWKYIDYPFLEKNPHTKMDLIYSPSMKLNITAGINANMYHIVEAISDKINLNKKLKQIKSKFIPRMYFENFEQNKSAIEELLRSTDTFYYLKGATGSTSRSTFIINNYSQIPLIVKENPSVKNWFFSENVNSFLYKRKGSYQPGGRVYNEQYGHKGRLKFFILFKIEADRKEVYMYDQSIYEIAPDEFTGDLNSRSQNIIIGMGSEQLTGYPEGYDTDPDYGFNPVNIFGEKYFKKIVPQLGKMTQDIFKVVNKDLYCKNDKYYNPEFKCCFHFGTVDVIITPKLKCYFLEINTKPVMDRPSYATIINYPNMVDSIVQICIDPYFPPELPSSHHRGWHKISLTKRSAKFKFYVSPTWKFSKEVKDFYKKRRTWEQIIYPNHLLQSYQLDFVGKRKRKDILLGDPRFQRGHLISKILTLDYYLGNKKYMYDILSNDPRSFKFLPLSLGLNTNYPEWEKNVKSLENGVKWIIKPGVGLRGQDILISKSTTEIINYIKQNTNYTEWIVSQYIDNPYLLKIYGDSQSGAVFNDKIGRKTHIRIYVLIKKINNKLSLYLYDQPVIFCAAKEYNGDIHDTYSQLTNLYIASIYYNQILKLDGNLAYKDLSFSLQKILNDLYGPGFYKRRILPQIKYMLKVILDNSNEYLQCSSQFIPGERNCFQNIAIDIMPDENWKLYILEINGKPGMNAPGYTWKGLEKFTTSMMETLIKKVKNKKGFINIK